MKSSLHAKYGIRFVAHALLLVLALSAVLIMGRGVVFAAAPTTGIGFQGQLYNGGSAVNGSVAATFSFYDALSGGSLQGSAISKTISVSNGYFATTFSSAELASIDLNQSLWIEVVVEGNTLTPRSPVNSVPFANKAFGAFSYASAPSAGPAGSLYYDSLNSRLMVSNGSSWATVGTTSSASIATTTINGASGPSFSFATGSSGTDFSIATSTGTVTFNIPTASASNRGLLSSSDYLRIPSSASSSEWASFFAAPSSRISAGANLVWTGNSIGFSGVLPVANGGTGTTTAPAFGQILMGNSSGGFNLVATSSLGITGGSGTNYLSLGNGYIAASTSTDAIRAAYFVASSTTATSTFAGAVGIGTTTPVATLAIVGSASAPSRNLLVLASSTGTAQLTVSASGEVGIGGSLSGNKLYVSGLTVLDSFNNGGGTTPLTIKNAGTSAGSLVTLAFHAGNSIQASLYADVAHNLRFNVRNTADTGSIEVMRLTGDGYVGIGTTTPAQTLSVAGSMRLTGAFFDSANASGTAGMVLQTTGTGTQWVATSSLGIVGGSGNSAFTIASGMIYNATSTDLVGIGTSSPSTTLFVQGKGGTNPFAIASSTGTNMLTLSQTGYLGIGNSSPVAPLTFAQVAGDKIQLYPGSASSRWGFGIQNWTFVQYMDGGNPGTGKFSWRTAPASGDASSGTEVANLYTSGQLDLLDSTNGVLRAYGSGNNYFAGNVGIGTTTPARTLSVAGSMRLTGAFFDSANASGTAGMVLQTTGTGTQWVATSSLGITGSSGSSDSAFTIASGMIYNATSTDLVGIGTSSPSTTLFVQGKGGTNPFAIASSTGTQVLTLSQAGNLGIGTTTPAAKISLSSGGVNPWNNASGGLYLTNNAGGTIVGFSNSTPNDYSIFGVYRPGGSVDAGDFQFNALGPSYSPSGLYTASTVLGAARSDFTGGLKLGAQAGPVSLFAGGIAASNIGLTLSTAGNVGIGTTTPAARLSVYDAGDSSSLATFTQGLASGGINVSSDFSAGNYTPGLFWSTINNNAGRPKAGIFPQHTNTGTFLYIGTSNDYATGISNTAIAIDPSGNVGIGSSSPATKLSITGVSGSLLDVLTVASSTQARLFSVSPAGTVTASGSIVWSSNGNSLGNNTLSFAGNNSTVIGNVSSGSSAAVTVQGGSNAASSLTLKSTSGVGTTDYLRVVVGNDGATEALRVVSSGKVGIGTTTPGQALTVAGNAQFTGVTSGAYASDLNLTAEGILTTSASDERLKENIQALGAPALPNILALKTYSFNWKSDPSHRADIGLIAQEVEPLFPELVFTNQNDGFKGINYSRLSVYLIKGMQEQQVQIDQLKNYATFIRTKELHTEKLCIGDETDEVCITKEDLRKMMLDSNIQPVGTSTPDIVPVVMPDSSPAVMSGDAGTMPPAEEGSPVTPPSDGAAASPDPSSAPVPEAVPDPAPASEAAPAPAPEAAPAPVDGAAGSGDVPAV